MEQAFKKGNDIDTAHQIALMYEYSLFGVKPDVVKAIDWFHIAAKNGHVEAMAEYANVLRAWMWTSTEQCWN